MKWFKEGTQHFQRTEYDQAIECWKKALELGTQEKIEHVISKSLMNIGTAYSSKGEWKKTLEFYYASLEIEKKRGDIPSIAENLMEIGDALFALEKREDSGLTIFKKNFIEIAWNEGLIGGFLSSIQSFGSELSREQMEMEKLAYKHFKIHFYDGKFIRCALITRGEITALLTQTLKNFLLDFETTYHSALSDYTGDVGQFNQATNLVDKHFKTK